MKKILLLTSVSLFCFIHVQGQTNENVTVPGFNINMTRVPGETVETSTTTATTNVTTDTTSVNLMPNGTMCPSVTLNASQFLNLKYKIEKQSSFNKKEFIETEIQKNCFSTGQVIQLVKLTTSYYQLDMAKLAYRHTLDTENYVQVADVLTISGQRQKLLDFVSTPATTTTAATSTSSTSTSTSTTVTTSGGGLEVVETTHETNKGGTVTATGCQPPQSEVGSIKNAIKAESFGDDKMNVAKQALTDRCITVTQVKSIMKLFSFEDEKLEFAKFAYDYIYDTKNYYQVNSSFDFSSTKQELNEYIKTK
ncbi:MAG: hypothetical protein ACJA0Q_000370 [Saprospiraceae bacterium]|jgi:hypothetical protein